MDPYAHTCAHIHIISFACWGWEGILLLGCSQTSGEEHLEGKLSKRRLVYDSRATTGKPPQSIELLRGGGAFCIIF